MERALASAWEEYGAMERESKGEGDRGRWKTGREAAWALKGERRKELPCLSRTDAEVEMREQSEGLKRGRN